MYVKRANTTSKTLPQRKHECVSLQIKKKREGEKNL